MIIWSPQTSLKLFASASDPNSPVREVWGGGGGGQRGENLKYLTNPIEIYPETRPI